MFLVLRALRRPITVIVAALAIFLAAGLAVRGAPVDIFPDLRVPVPTSATGRPRTFMPCSRLISEARGSHSWAT